MAWYYSAQHQLPHALRVTPLCGRRAAYQPTRSSRQRAAGGSRPERFRGCERAVREARGEPLLGAARESGAQHVRRVAADRFRVGAVQRCERRGPRRASVHRLVVTDCSSYGRNLLVRRLPNRT